MFENCPRIWSADLVNMLRTVPIFGDGSQWRCHKKYVEKERNRGNISIVYKYAVKKKEENRGIKRKNNIK